MSNLVYDERLVESARNMLETAPDKASNAKVFKRYTDLIRILVDVLETKVDHKKSLQTKVWVESRLMDGVEQFLPDTSIIRFGDKRYEGLNNSFNSFEVRLNKENHLVVRHGYRPLILEPRVSNEVTIRTREH